VASCAVESCDSYSSPGRFPGGNQVGVDLISHFPNPPPNLVHSFPFFFHHRGTENTAREHCNQRKSPPSCPPPPGKGEGGDFRDGLGNGSRFGLFLVVNFLFYRKISCLTRTIHSPFKFFLEGPVKNNSPSIPIDYANILIPLQKPCCERNSCKIVRGNLHSY